MGWGESKGPAGGAKHKEMVLRLTPELHEQVRARAIDEDRSMSQLVRRALRVYLATPSPPGSLSSPGGGG